MDNHCNWTGTCELCNKWFQKLNAIRSRCHLLEINGTCVTVCSKFTDAQRRLLPGGSVVTTQEHADNLLAPTLANEADKAAFCYVHVLVSFLVYVFLAIIIVTLHVTMQGSIIITCMAVTHEVAHSISLLSLKGDHSSILILAGYGL